MTRHIRPGEVDPNRSLHANAAEAIEQRLRELLAYEPCLSDADRVLELHEMRIAAKRLRYTMEIFAPLFAGSPASSATYDSAVRVVKQVQALLGTLHDADVLFPDLLGHLVSLAEPHRKALPLGVHTVDLAAVEGIVAACKRLREERNTAYAKLNEEWQAAGRRSTFSQLAALLRRDTAQESADPEDPSHSEVNSSSSRPRRSRKSAAARPLADSGRHS